MMLCQIISRHPIMRYVDGRNWTLCESIRWTYIDDSGVEILTRIPRGFRTDLASIPAIVPIPEGPYNLAGVIHDYLYQTGICTRAEADRVLYDGCRLLGVPAYRSWIIYAGVRAGGWVVWKRYRRRSTITS